MTDDRASDLPALSIRRPWLVIVINLLIVIAGLGAWMGVEVRELPNIDRPIVAVVANYPGAAPETLDAEVTRLLEGAASRVPGVYLVRSSSEEGNLRVIIEFNPGVDLVTAANDVRDAVARVQRSLPSGVENLTVIKADADADPVMQLAVSSRTLAVDELSRVVEEQIEAELVSVEGVADITLFGTRQRVMRVRIDPLRLAAYNVSVDDIATLLRSARVDVPAGSLESSNQEVLVRANASVTTPAQLRALRLNPALALGDVADVFYGPADATSYVRLNGEAVISLGVVRQAQSNSVAISEGVRAVVDRLNQNSGDLTVSVVSDDAVFISGAIREVVISLGLAVLIVVAVVGVFLGQWRATLVPVVAIPVALIGTLGAIWMLGFSVNLLTLLALLLATGLVVDDAIVVLENIQRRRGQGLLPRAAAVLGTREVFFAIVATTATLVSVFVPISFLPSAAGRLFAEFGFVMAIAVAISSFVALSLGPMISSRLPEARAPGPVWRRLSAWGNRGIGAYDRWLARALGRAWWVFGVCVLLAVGAAFQGWFRRAAAGRTACAQRPWWRGANRRAAGARRRAWRSIRAPCAGPRRRSRRGCRAPHTGARRCTAACPRRARARRSRPERHGRRRPFRQAPRPRPDPPARPPPSGCGDSRRRRRRRLRPDRHARVPATSAGAMARRLVAAARQSAPAATGTSPLRSPT